MFNLTSHKTISWAINCSLGLDMLYSSLMGNCHVAAAAYSSQEADTLTHLSLKTEVIHLQNINRHKELQAFAVKKTEDWNDYQKCLEKKNSDKIFKYFKKYFKNLYGASMKYDWQLIMKVLRRLRQLAAALK